MSVDIWTAAATGNVDSLRELLAPEAEVSVDIRDDWARTPLMVAAVHDQAAAAQCLIDAGANLTLQDAESGYSALHRALSRWTVAWTTRTGAWLP